MLEGFTQKDLDQFAAECLEKYEKKEYDLMLLAAAGGVPGYTELIKKLTAIDFNFAVEMYDYSDTPAPDITYATRDGARQARDNGNSVEEFAYQWLQFQMDIAEAGPLAQLHL